jgi:hypothetical protein
MEYDLTADRLNEVLQKTDFSDLNTHIGGCTSVVAGISEVVESDGFVIPTNEDEEIIHAFIKVDGKLFDSNGLQYSNQKEVVNIVHNYNPFDSSKYKPEHFPLKSFSSVSEIDEYLWYEFVNEHDSYGEFPVILDIKSEVSNRIKKTIENTD